MKKSKMQSGLSSPETKRATVRERTLAHLKNLMETATVVGAGIVLACGARAQTPRPPQVCDPPPPPAPGCCENPDQFLLFGCLSEEAHWAKSGMRWSIELSLSAHGGRSQVSFEGLKREAIMLSGVSIKDMKVEPQEIGFTLRAVARNRQAMMQFPVLCNGKKVVAKLTLDLSKPPAKSGSVPVRLVK